MTTTTERPPCTCSPTIKASTHHYAFCAPIAWDRQNGLRPLRFVMAGGKLSAPKIKRDGRWIDA